MKNSLIISSCIGLVVSVTGCSGVRPSDLGIKNGLLAPCPASPNCVSSQSRDSEHRVEPMRYSVSPREAVTDMKKIILAMKRSRIVEENDSYIHAEFTSPLWRFVDDVEFYFDDNAKLIHVRSAARLGRSDFGVNRKRVETIRAAWTALER